MRVIKRYSNRKLYDTETKKYITLDQIADLIRNGEELKVVANDTGDDLTTLTMSQIILEMEKKQKGFLPQPVLSALVEAGGKPLSSLRKHLETPLGFIYQVDAEIERRIELLVKRGELAEEHARKLIDQLLDYNPMSRSANSIDDEEIERILKNLELPSADDIQILINQIETISKKLRGWNK